MVWNNGLKATLHATNALVGLPANQSENIPGDSLWKITLTHY
jgi:hypothetical protein